jgi:predicted metal-dependent HD superfamily phosphohydrolase
MGWNLDGGAPELTVRLPAEALRTDAADTFSAAPVADWLGAVRAPVHVLHDARPAVPVGHRPLGADAAVVQRGGRRGGRPRHDRHGASQRAIVGRALRDLATVPEPATGNAGRQLREGDRRTGPAALVRRQLREDDGPTGPAALVRRQLREDDRPDRRRGGRHRRHGSYMYEKPREMRTFSDMSDKGRYRRAASHRCPPTRRPGHAGIAGHRILTRPAGTVAQMEPAADPATAVLPTDVHDRLRRRYAEPVRRYHTFAHARRVASLAAELGGDRACLLAAWFHDAVYRPGAADDEDRSAELLLEWLPDDPDAPEAARLVRLTATHVAPPGDVQGAVLCDADLAVLGGSAAAYAQYVAAVRAEFTAVPDAAWRTGRAVVLQRLLDRQPLFATGEGRRRWEATARRNLTAELAALSG